MYTGEGINQERRGAISLEDSEIIRLYWERNEPAADLPEEYDFSYHASYEDTLAAAGYLKETYAGLTGMDDPQINVCGGDCDIYGSRSYRVELYENGGSLAEKIVNCHFRRAVFYCDEVGRLCGMRLYCPDLSEKVGDYPLITAEEARELLVRGGYVSSVPYEMPGEEYVAKSELVYRTGRRPEDLRCLLRPRRGRRLHRRPAPMGRELQRLTRKRITPRKKGCLRQPFFRG